VAHTFINLPAHDQPEQVIEIPEAQDIYAPMKYYAVRLAEEDKGKALYLVMHRGLLFSMVPGGILMVLQDGKELIDKAGLSFEHYQLKGESDSEIRALFGIAEPAPSSPKPGSIDGLVSENPGRQ
jgi:hypothetical protein